jgi:hypothetical protein
VEVLDAKAAAESSQEPLMFRYVLTPLIGGCQSGTTASTLASAPKSV